MRVGTNPVTFECAKCHTHKTKEKFPRRSRLPDGIEKTCKECRNLARTNTPSRSSEARHKEYVSNDNGDRYRRNRARRLTVLGVDYDWYFKQFSSQDGKCAICRKPEKRVNPKTGQTFLLAVDHDHNSGQVRGLLCTSCNKGLGLLGDTIESLEAALNYLRSIV